MVKSMSPTSETTSSEATPVVGGGGADCLPQLFCFFLQLGEDAFHIGPVEAALVRTRPQLGGLQQRRKPARNAIERRREPAAPSLPA